MRFEAIKHVCDLLALVRSKSRHVDQRLDSFGACERDDRAGVGVSRHDDRSLRPIQCAVERSHVVSPRAQSYGAGVGLWAIASLTGPQVCAR